MIWIFTCVTNDCVNKKNPVYLKEVINPVLCSICRVESDAIEVEESTK
jgi:hypothetical protein